MKKIVKMLKKKNKTISTMESCTGGLVASSITDIPDASIVLKFSAVTYSNEFKIKMGVDKKLIEKYTVYSIEVARDMANKISLFTNSNYGIGVTGKINKPDLNNYTESDDTIYVSIYDKDNDIYYDNVLKTIAKSRIKNKKYIIKEIEKMLLSIISN